jgi:uncharacterized protein (DUF983 family)
MLKKGTVINSILTGSCPKCQEESMYVVKNPYQLKTLYKMHEKCSHCGTVYKIEPSFFYGAMYVSYGVSIAFGVAFFVITHYFLPVIARLSRNIYINLFVHFDKDWKNHS